MNDKSYLINNINVHQKQNYLNCAIREKETVIRPIDKREYLVPKNARSSAIYFWQNVLMINPVLDGHTFISAYIPVDNNSIIVRTRFSHHESGALANWTKYEANGMPNKRIDIYFDRSEDLDNVNDIVEKHVINNKHLYSNEDVQKLQQSLSVLFQTGSFVNPFTRETEPILNNIQIKDNKEMKTNRNKVRLTESQLHRVIKEAVNRILSESIDPVYDELSRPNGELDTSNPYTWAESPGALKKMGYDENGMKRGKKYYDKLLNPDWRFNKDYGWSNAVHYALGENEPAERDLAQQEKSQNAADKRWQHAADTRPLHRKNSLNRA